YIHGQELLAISCSRTASAQMFLRSLNPKTGELIWSAPLGTPQLISEMNWGSRRLPQPHLDRSGSRYYVLTNNGALICIDAMSRQSEWVFKPELPESLTRQPRYVRMNTSNLTADGLAVPIVVDRGTIYFKELGASTLYAI